jgi:hypothetical protein
VSGPTVMYSNPNAIKSLRDKLSVGNISVSEVLDLILEVESQQAHGYRLQKRLDHAYKIFQKINEASYVGGKYGLSQIQDLTEYHLYEPHERGVSPSMMEQLLARVVHEIESCGHIDKTSKVYCDTKRLLRDAGLVVNNI